MISRIPVILDDGATSDSSGTRGNRSDRARTVGCMTRPKTPPQITNRPNNASPIPDLSEAKQWARVEDPVVRAEADADRRPQPELGTPALVSVQAAANAPCQ